MKFSATAIAVALVAPLALAQEPSVGVGAPVPRDPSYLEKRANSATVLVDGLRYRRCPRTSCTADGQFAEGTKISLACYTRTNTDTIGGDKGWGKIASNTGKGDWVALANQKYVSWSGGLPAC